MKKSWCLFGVFSVVFVIAITLGGVFASRVSGAMSAVFVLSGTAAWTVFFLHFRSTVYTVENGVLLIRGGVFIKTERRISTQDILWSTNVKIGSVPLFSVIHTAAGRAVIFTSADVGASPPIQKKLK